MTEKFYVVQVNDVPATYPPRYFPRKFRHVKKAIACAKEAIKAGATMARVEYYPSGAERDFRPEAKGGGS
jgi:hypothetical protein